MPPSFYEPIFMEFWQQENRIIFPSLWRRSRANLMRVITIICQCFHFSYFIHFRHLSYRPTGICRSTRQFQAGWVGISIVVSLPFIWFFTHISMITAATFGRVCCVLLQQNRYNWSVILPRYPLSDRSDCVRDCVGARINNILVIYTIIACCSSW